MAERLCSKNFLKFYDEIEKIGLSIRDIAKIVEDNIYLVVDDLSIGKLDCIFFAPPTAIEKEGQNIHSVLYENPDGYSDAPCSFEFVTGEGGKAVFEAYPKKECEWNAEEVDEVRFLCKNIFVMCGRCRLSDIIKNTISRDLQTGLLSLNGFMEHGNRLMSAGRIADYAAIYFNLKNFKYVNSQIGNRRGDGVIRMYSSVLSEKIGADGVAARLGGDNFTLLIKKERLDEILQFLSGVNLEVEIGGRPTHLNVSARAGAYNIESGDTMPHVMNCISLAVSTAKRPTSPDIVVFNKEILEKISREQKIAADFPRAIANREFVVYYQPKVDLETSEICGCEALVRWFKDGEMIPPLAFIPIFERDGNVCALDFYMLENVCRNICEWKEKGIEPVTVSVNFSKTHLHNPDIAEDILSVIHKYGVDCKYIEIEMTEMSDFNSYDAFKSLVTKLKANGVRTSIDDFGTGYSSLNLLTDFMFDIVKLDKSFFDNIIKSGSKTDEIVVRNMLKMISELDMDAIAEGVETVEQARFLKELKCTMVQGFLFDRPLPVEEFEKRLVARKYNSIV